jgi:hypothetical protein
VEIQEGNEGEAISYRGGFASLYKFGSMRPFLDTEVNRERGREGEGRSSESQKWLPGAKFKVGPNLGASKGQGF